MTVTTSREFDQDTGRAKEAARKGPVFIIDHGRPSHVLLTIEDYQRLTGSNMSLAEALAQWGDAADFEFNPPRLHIRTALLARLRSEPVVDIGRWDRDELYEDAP